MIPTVNCARLGLSALVLRAFVNTHVNILVNTIVNTLANTPVNTQVGGWLILLQIL